YPLLHSLEAHGLVETEWVESDGGPPRKYYRVTPEGETALERALALWRNLVSSAEAVMAEDGGGVP
ncbi:MAG: PadR family transcriptional regulator, partial [Thermoplasmata archaeon]